MGDGQGTRTLNVAEPSVWRVLAEDLRRQNGDFTRPGFQALAVQRLGAHATLRRLSGGPLRPLWTLAFAILEAIRFLLIRNVYGIEVHYGSHVGRRVVLAHQPGIIVHHLASIGDDCVIHHNVTIGRGSRTRRGAAPHIGERVEIGPGAVLLGPISIGDDAVVAPNAVVMTDVPPGSHVLPSLARAVRLGGSSSEDKGHDPRVDGPNIRGGEA